MSPKRNRLRPRAVLAAVALVGVTAAGAQSLGPVKATLWIGRPLDVLVPSELVGDDPASMCAEARVRFGETVLAPGEVTLSIVRDDPRGAGLRVRTRSVVDEPFVTVEVRIGCQGSLTRSYTLLADLEPMRPPAAAMSASPSPAPVARSAAVPTPAAPSSAAPDANPAEPPVHLPPAASRPPGVSRLAAKSRPVTATAPASSSRGVVRTAPVARAAGSTGPRLKLEPVEIGPAQTTPAPTPQPAASTAAPESAASGPNAAAAQQELERMRAEQQRLLLAVETLNRELAMARSLGWFPWLGWGLAAVAAVLAGLGWWGRRRTGVVAAPPPGWWALPGVPPPTPSPSAAAPMEAGTVSSVPSLDSGAGQTHGHATPVPATSPASAPAPTAGG